MLYIIIFLLFSNSILLSEYYYIGSTINISDQDQEFDICYGNYPDETFKFSDLNLGILELE